MGGYISEFFGYRAEDNSEMALNSIDLKICPFINKQCTKSSNKYNEPSGVCTIRQVSQGSPDVICCPNRLYDENYKLLRLISADNFSTNLNLYPGTVAVEKAKLEDGAIAVFDKNWDHEIGIPTRDRKSSYYIDWILARLDKDGTLKEFLAIEVQSIDTTGSYWKAR
jgi:hypothetical protein